MSRYDIFRIRLVKQIDFFSDDDNPTPYKSYLVGEIHEAYQDERSEYYTLWATDEGVHWDEAVKL